MMNKLFIAIPILAFVLIAGLAVFPVPITYSEGARIGTIDKFSNKGLFIKSWEGELALNSFNTQPDGTMSNRWHFSVPESRTAIIDSIQAFAAEGAKIKLEYEQLVSTGIRYDTQYFITGISREVQRE